MLQTQIVKKSVLEEIAADVMGGSLIIVSAETKQKRAETENPFAGFMATLVKGSCRSHFELLQTMVGKLAEDTCHAACIALLTKEHESFNKASSVWTGNKELYSLVALAALPIRAADILGYMEHAFVGVLECHNLAVAHGLNTVIHSSDDCEAKVTAALKSCIDGTPEVRQASIKAASAFFSKTHKFIDDARSPSGLHDFIAAAGASEFVTTLEERVGHGVLPAFKGVIGNIQKAVTANTVAMSPNSKKMLSVKADKYSELLNDQPKG